MSRKKTIEEVRAAFNQRGFTLVSEEYKCSNSPLKYLCSSGHKTKIRFAHLQTGYGCADCAGQKKKTIEEVKQIFTDRGYTLLTIEYKNALSLLSYICDKGHQTNIRFNNLMSGQGCIECSRTKKKTFEEVKQLFEERSYELVSKEYKNSGAALLYICDNGHQAKISFSSLQRGSGCPSCAEHGFNPNKSATLYYIRFQYEGNFYYKIGITNNTTSKRFKSEKIAYTVLKETVYSLGKDAHDKEQAILKKFSASRYKGKPFLVQGNTELFSRDVLQLDDSILKAGRM